MTKILIISPYPPEQAPSQRFRYEQYLSQLKQNGSMVSVQPFFSRKAYDVFYQSGNLFSKIHAITDSFIRRLLLLFRLPLFDFVFIHREAAPIGPPIIEWIIAKVAGKKIIYDFDDAIWLSDNTEQSLLAKAVRWRQKVGVICKWSYRVSCGNTYLAEYARQYNANTVIVPTTIDTATLHIPAKTKKAKEKVTVGWTGTYSTLKYLRTILPALQAVGARYPETEFLFIGDKDPGFALQNVIFKSWRKETEIADLSEIDIGIMPLPDDQWTRGKCGFKALQYMAMGIPALASPVGVNREIIDQGKNGYLCSSFEEWFQRLNELILDSDKRSIMGEHGRKKVVDHYSVASNAATFMSLFQ